MKEKQYFSNPDFWKSLDEIIREKDIFIDRPKGSHHPRFKEFIYPFDYGYIKNTRSSDGEELDVWIGTSKQKQVTGILNITDMDKQDTELKILYACTRKEMEEIYKINNELMMSAVLLIR